MRAFAAILVLCGASTCAAAPVTVEHVRTWPAPDHTRVVFDVDRSVEHTLFVLTDPDRVVIDLRDARLATTLPRASSGDHFVERLRAAPRGKGNLRIVIDLKARVRPRSFQLKPTGQYGHRLVVDLLPASATPVATKSIRDERKGPRDLVIAIDPGHGGDDPGAIGAHGTREKDVTLAISKRLERMVDRERGMRAVLTRTGDYYVGLRKRMEIARLHGADLFVSIHADAFRDPRVEGSSVYILSRKGASSEAARWLADQENKSDLVGGVSLDGKGELLASVLLDLSQTATLSASTEVGTSVLDALRRLGRTHKRHVERAGFMVLKSPDIPSILVETNYISNPTDERRLKEPAYQRALAAAVLKGIKRYFERNPPPGTVYASRRHVIVQGDTLSGIAARYGVSTSALRSANGLAGNDRIHAGDVLRIPRPSSG